MKAVQRLIAARSKDERAAVESVLHEFFELLEDGWHNRRADEELARYEEKRQKARGSARARWDAPQSHAKRNANAMRTHSKEDANAMRTHSKEDANALQTQCEGNALQSPVSSLQSPDVLESPSQDTHAPTPISRAHDPLPGSDPPHVPTPASAVCVLLRSMGMLDGHPDHPQLRALIAAGATIGEFECAGREALGKGKGFAYAMAVVRGQREAAARIAAMPQPPGPERTWEPPDDDDLPEASRAQA